MIHFAKDGMLKVQTSNILLELFSNAFCLVIGQHFATSFMEY